MKEENKMVVKRRFERINNMMELKLYTKYEDIPQNIETFVYGFKHIETDKSIIFYYSVESQMNYKKMMNYSISCPINL